MKKNDLRLAACDGTTVMVKLTNGRNVTPGVEKPDRDKLIYPMQQTANGILQSFFATYLNSLWGKIGRDGIATLLI